MNDVSKLSTSISDLERELALKKGYQAVKFVLPKSTPDDVAKEIQDKLREVAESLAMKSLPPGVEVVELPGTFTGAQLNALKMLADTVLKKAAPQGDVPVTTAPMPLIPTPAAPSTARVPQPRKAKIVTAENVRGEAKRFAGPDDEIYIPDPDKLDAHGMVSATHMRKGMMMKIPLDDVEFVN